MKRTKRRIARTRNGGYGSSSDTSGGPKPDLIHSHPPDTSSVSAAGSTVSPSAKPFPSAPSARIPPILLEGDEPPRTALAGPGEKFALGAATSVAHHDSRENELPSGYGTGRLVLTPRDPHCLYACWDLTAEQQRLCNSNSTHHHLLIRLHRDALGGSPVNEVHVHPESRHWFIHVEQAGRRYVAELGYSPSEGEFRTVAVSEPVVTPPDVAAEEPAVEFKSITFESFERPANAATASPENPAQTVAVPSRGASTPDSPSGEVSVVRRGTLAQKSALRPGLPTRAQEGALAEVTGWRVVSEHSPGSAEIAALLQRAAQPSISPPVGQFAVPLAAVAEISGREGGLGTEISSPPGGEFPAQKGFWFNLNAELVIYGATEPGAQVTIAGRSIPLRSDGSFSCRFALPDGYYHLVVSAIATNGEERHAKLEFYRGTRYRGEVGLHPQDPGLKPPPEPTGG